VDSAELGTEILRRASDVSDRPIAQLLLADFKEFMADGARFGIGTIETADDTDVLERRDELLAAMAAHRARGYTSVIFAVIDIIHERTTLLVEGDTAAVAAAFDAPPADPHTIHLPGILSRKKHIVPLLGAVARRIAAG
jgi:manganese-dependent inorganic pyrophosphatase